MVESPCTATPQKLKQAFIRLVELGPPNMQIKCNVTHNSNPEKVSPNYLINTVLF